MNRKILAILTSMSLSVSILSPAVMAEDIVEVPLEENIENRGTLPEQAEVIEEIIPTPTPEASPTPTPTLSPGMEAEDETVEEPAEPEEILIEDIPAPADEATAEESAILAEMPEISPLVESEESADIFVEIDEVNLQGAYDEQAYLSKMAEVRDEYKSKIQNYEYDESKLEESYIIKIKEQISAALSDVDVAYNSHLDIGNLDIGYVQTDLELDMVVRESEFGFELESIWDDFRNNVDSIIDGAKYDDYQICDPIIMYVGREPLDLTSQLHHYNVGEELRIDGASDCFSISDDKTKLYALKSGFLLMSWDCSVYSDWEHSVEIRIYADEREEDSESLGSVDAYIGGPSVDISSYLEHHYDGTSKIKVSNESWGEIEFSDDCKSVIGKSVGMVSVLWDCIEYPGKTHTLKVNVQNHDDPEDKITLELHDQISLDEMKFKVWSLYTHYDEQDDFYLEDSDIILPSDDGNMFTANKLGTTTLTYPCNEIEGKYHSCIVEVIEDGDSDDYPLVLTGGAIVSPGNFYYTAKHYDGGDIKSDDESIVKVITDGTGNKFYQAVATGETTIYWQCYGDENLYHSRRCIVNQDQYYEDVLSKLLKNLEEAEVKNSTNAYNMPAEMSKAFGEYIKQTREEINEGSFNPVDDDSTHDLKTLLISADAWQEKYVNSHIINSSDETYLSPMGGGVSVNTEEYPYIVYYNGEEPPENSNDEIISFQKIEINGEIHWNYNTLAVGETTLSYSFYDDPANYYIVNQKLKIKEHPDESDPLGTRHEIKINRNYPFFIVNGVAVDMKSFRGDYDLSSDEVLYGTKSSVADTIWDAYTSFWLADTNQNDMGIAIESDPTSAEKSDFLCNIAALAETDSSIDAYIMFNTKSAKHSFYGAIPVTIISNVVDHRLDEVNVVMDDSGNLTSLGFSVNKRRVQSWVDTTSSDSNPECISLNDNGTWKATNTAGDVRIRVLYEDQTIEEVLVHVMDVKTAVPSAVPTYSPNTNDPEKVPGMDSMEEEKETDDSPEEPEEPDSTATPSPTSAPKATSTPKPTSAPAASATPVAKAGSASASNGGTGNSVTNPAANNYTSTTTATAVNTGDSTQIATYILIILTALGAILTTMYSRRERR